MRTQVVPGTWPSLSFSAGGGGGGVLIPPLSYATNFTTVENPLSDGGKFIGGFTTGLDWANMRVTSSGKCSGNQNIDISGSFRDGTAILNPAVVGAYSANQQAQGTCYVTSLTSTSSPEVELRLRSVITPNVNRGYEIGWSNQTGANAYLIIVRWNGAVGDFSYLFNVHDPSYNATTGDVLKATIVGNTLKAFKNGVEQASVDITSIGGTVWTTGNPGMGHNSEEVGGAHNSQYGWSAWSATEL